jgi:uncharacterized protein
LLWTSFFDEGSFLADTLCPFEDLKRITNFELDEKLHAFLESIVTEVLHYIFSILFAVGFYIQWDKNKADAVNF